MHFTSELKKYKTKFLEIFADLPGHNMNGGTIPKDINQTALRTDIG